ncbi:MAG: ABC transporter ATP-binding protein [Candidatus Delongbacteria bacterium]|nr:ABC transporter ATP-binding protein [Candidatus Delongbacteria bacterium]
MTYSTLQEEEYTKRFDLNLWRQALRFVKPYRREVIALIAVMVGVAVLEAIPPFLTRQAIDLFVVPGQLDGLGWFLAIYGAIVILMGLGIWLLIVLAGKIDVWVCYDIRRAGFKRLQELDFSYYDRTPVGWLMARMVSDTERLAETVAWGLVDMVWGVSMMTVIIGVMLYLNWWLALIVLTVVPPLVWVSAFFQKRILKSYREVRRTNSRITGAFNEGIMGARTTKTLVRERANLQQFTGLTGKMYRSSFLAAVQSSLYLPLVLVLGSIGAGLGVWFGGSGVIAGVVTYGTLVAFIVYVERFFEPVREVARIFAELQSAQAAAERIFALLSTEPEIVDNDAVRQLMGTAGIYDPNRTDAVVAPAVFPEIKGAVTFEQVGFAYKDGTRVLADFNLEVVPGETIALVGATGGGKSTIANLVCRFYEPTSGRVLIDGVDYRERSLHWLQSNLGVVLQTPQLFSGTVRDNIAYGRLEASAAEIEQAARQVRAWDFISAMEQGMDSPVGEGGGLLSTGQKQLVSFARAVLADPRIFVMDEATSSVDTETELLIQEALDKLLQGRTSFVIAHRLSTIRKADRILVVEDGCITEAGDHESLMKLEGRYFDLYTRRFERDRINKILH